MGGKEERERGRKGEKGGMKEGGRKEQKKEWNERKEMEVEGEGCERRQRRRGRNKKRKRVS